jgi:hypothetical protein
MPVSILSKKNNNIINGLLSNFIWNLMTSRVKWTVLHLPCKAEALGLPQMKLYYWAAQLVSLKQWTADYPCAWRGIEAMSVIPYDLKNYFGSKALKSKKS